MSNGVTAGPYIDNRSDTEKTLDTLGHPGKYIGATTVADGQTDYTGSNFGYGAVIVKTHGSAIFHLTDGGTIAATNLSAGVVYDLSLAKITAASSAGSGESNGHGGLS